MHRDQILRILLDLALRETIRVYTSARKLEPDILDRIELDIAVHGEQESACSRFLGVDGMGNLLILCKQVLSIAATCFPKAVPYELLTGQIADSILEMSKRGVLSSEIKNDTERNFLIGFLDIEMRFSGWNGDLSGKIKQALGAVCSLRFEFDDDWYGKGIFDEYISVLTGGGSGTG